MPTGCEEYWHAFQDLTNSRQSGMGPTGISMSDELAWLQINQIEKEEWEDFHYFIRALDSKWLDWARSKSGPSKQPQGA